MPQKIPTGCDVIDKILQGGIPSGSVSLIYGEAETGKTTLALQCAVSCAAKGYKALFVDCDGTFSVRRLSQIIPERFKEIVERIILMRPTSFNEQELVINQLTDYVTKNFGPVIIDTVTTLYRLRVAEVPEKTFELNRELNRQMALLAQTAKTQKIAILITSQVRDVLNDTYVNIEPVGTRVLRFWSDIIISLKPTENPRIIRAVLEKDPKKVQPLTCYLRIGEKGMQEYLIR